MTGLRRVPRSRGALSGFMLMLLGTWGGLAPFIGPYADIGFTPAHDPWIWTDARGWLSVLPGIVVVFGGMVLLSSASRTAGAFGAWLGTLGGAWFVAGGTAMAFWNGPVMGQAVGSADKQAAEQLTFFTGLGVVIVYFAALALGRLSVVGVRDVKLAEREAEAAQAPYAGPPAPEQPAPEQPEPEPFTPEPIEERDREPRRAGRYSFRKPRTDSPPADRRVVGVGHTRPDL
ncbi:MAG: hypothetical protein ABIS86_00070 [Streptosporangiaceae bacterium]